MVALSGSLSPQHTGDIGGAQMNVEEGAFTTTLGCQEFALSTFSFLVFAAHSLHS